MPEFEVTFKQKEALRLIGGSYEIVSKAPSGDIIIRVGPVGNLKSPLFSITPTGSVDEIKPKQGGKEKKWKSGTPDEIKKPAPKTYHLEKPQRDLLVKNGLTEADIFSQLSNKDIIVKLKGSSWVFGFDGLSMSKVDYDKQYGGMSKKTSTAAPSYTYSYKTICQKSPERCKPRQIEHVFWDADNTIWDLKGTAANVTGRLEKVDDDTVVEYGKGFSGYYSPPEKKSKKKKLKPDEAPNVYGDIWATLADEYGEVDEEELAEIEESLTEGLTEKDREFLEAMAQGARPETALLALPPSTTPPEPAKEEKEHEVNRITLLPTFRKTLDELEKRGIKSSLISLNTPGSVSRILKVFGIDKRFVEIRDSYQNKGKVFKELTHKHNICPCASAFLDDNSGNISEVAKECGLALQIGKGKDVEKPFDIFAFIKDK
jgi:FMN phosphatase YigB (HAD superfamily)